METDGSIHHLLKMNKYYNLISEFSFYLSHVTITTLMYKHLPTRQYLEIKTLNFIIHLIAQLICTQQVMEDYDTSICERCFLECKRKVEICFEKRMMSEPLGHDFFFIYI
ncbi:hypothetical protein T4B_6539, partial [Trichinella pseudospiralis]